jgi:signal transduction histidine kinase
VQIDFAQLEQSLLNLVSNAAYAMRANGGTIQVIASTQVCLDQADALKRARMACLSVIDQGEGIALDIQQKIFEPFFTTKPVGAGTGLGLSAVHGVVTNHGGTVHVDSQPGRGTAFHLLLPCLEGPTTFPTFPITPSREPTHETPVDRRRLGHHADEPQKCAGDRRLSSHHGR